MKIQGLIKQKINLKKSACFASYPAHREEPSVGALALVTKIAERAVCTVQPRRAHLQLAVHLLLTLSDSDCEEVRQRFKIIGFYMFPEKCSETIDFKYLKMF
jgi:hypothetical protein